MAGQPSSASGTLERVDAWLVLGSALFTNLTTGLNSLLIIRGRIFATLVRNLDFLCLFSTFSSTEYTGASVGVVHYI
jgi:hypothetical protein